MKTFNAYPGTHVTTQAHSGILTTISRTALLSKLKDLQHGEVVIEDGGEPMVFGRRTAFCPLSVSVTVHDRQFYPSIAFEGSVGGGEGYMKGYWSCSDLTALVRIFVINREILDRVDSGFAALSRPLLKLFHRMRKNTRAGSRQNIAEHYDLGNDFYQLFLDPTMTYSAGIFEREDSTLEEASRAKLDRMCRKLQLTSDDHVLEIGTGWGSFAIHAASTYGCRVTTTTISKKQYELAKERIEAAGLSDRITLLLEDYRDLTGTYSKIASIEMIEAVGWQYYDTFFQKCGELLKEEGMMVLQAITIQDQVYDRARKSVDFIQRYIFPGCCIPSITALCESGRRASDLKLFHFEDFAPHYAKTLREWKARVLKNQDAIRALGYSDEFLRMWEFYLAYCEGGFLERSLGSTQMVFTKPQCRVAPILGDL